MIQKIVDVLVNKQSKNQVMTDEDEKIYRYGYVLLCEVFLNIIIALAIGIVFSRTKELIFFLSMYIPLRSFCGGWHANKIWKCTVISNAILLLQVYGLEKLLSHLSIGTMLLMFFLNMICIFFIAPVETEIASVIEETAWRGYGEDAVGSYFSWFTCRRWRLSPCRHISARRNEVSRRGLYRIRS